jgi:hypothetical protein
MTSPRAERCGGHEVSRSMVFFLDWLYYENRAPNDVGDTLAAWFSFLTGCITRTNWSYPLSFFLSPRAYLISPDHISRSQCDGLCQVTQPSGAPSSPPRAVIGTGAVFQAFYSHAPSHRQVPGSGFLIVYFCDCTPASFPYASVSFTHSHTLSLDSYCKPTTCKSSSPAGLSTLVCVYVVDCASASPNAYSSSTHRFPENAIL